jgi:hypothetical protein
MNSCIGATSRLKMDRWAPKHHLDNGRKLTLHCGKPGLILPSMKRLTIVLYDKLYRRFIAAGDSLLCNLRG